VAPLWVVQRALLQRDRNRRCRSICQRFLLKVRRAR
jgi:hypothetical protein